MLVKISHDIRIDFSPETLWNYTDPDTIKVDQKKSASRFCSLVAKTVGSYLPGSVVKVVCSGLVCITVDGLLRGFYPRLVADIMTATWKRNEWIVRKP